jgi:ATPase subunit of ABC transporter with duplicated ATPase domains
MRPVQLVLDGFATFRTRAVIDFTDADYFALVGATGAGKSTVLDGITFALYGSVPRWNDKRMISPALAPTASVRLSGSSLTLTVCGTPRPARRAAAAERTRRSRCTHRVWNGFTTRTTSTATPTCWQRTPR